jgi:molybdenum cofactor cytidylyltransferase
LTQLSVSAVVLAAGASSRMGAMKQLLPFGETTLLETVIANVRRARVDEIIVVLGASADEIRGKLAVDQSRIVINPEFHQGMGTSLRCGIAQVSTDAALVVLADQPFVEASTINRLVEEYCEKEPQIVIPVYRGFRGNPVLLDRSVFPEIMGLSGDIGCRAIFGGHSENILKVPVDDVGVLLDIDTREDFEKLRHPAARTIESADVSGREADPRPRVVIVGSEKSGRTLANLAKLMNFGVTIIDPFLPIAEAAGADRVLRDLDFSKLSNAGETFVVIASGGRFDEEAVEQALGTGARYVALVANRKRAQEVLERVTVVDPEKLKTVRTKAGIDIHAEGPEEIALSIMAEIIAERHRIA